jgi:oligopeptide/dipeptide ABC transporter ATP-binding protein
VSGRDLLLNVEDLVVRFRMRRGLFGSQSYDVLAVNRVSFEMSRGETLGIVGESGAGKSTIGRALLKLTDVASGTILLNGKPIGNRRGEILDFRRDLQAIFQDPYSSLNPSMVVSDIIGEPLKVHYRMKEDERKKRVAKLMEQVGLSPHQMQRYPSEFSGGQRQRIAVAAALALEPKIIICDEAVSALDVSTQSQVINLLEELQDRLDIALLFIAHDLAVVRHISDRIGVMYLGQLMEMGPASRICDEPAHPYTMMLLASIPLTNPVEQKKRKKIRQQMPVAELPGPNSIPPGCPFATRCPEAMDNCHDERPEATAAPGGGTVFCHLY